MKPYVFFFVILSLLSFLTIPAQSDADVIHACKNDRNGRIRIVDDVDDCGRRESPLSWNTKGIQGEPGEPGSPGPPGPSGGFDLSKLYVVTCDGSFLCRCEDRGGRHFISGTAVCPMTELATQTYLHLTNYFEETEEFEAVCTSAVYTDSFSSIYTPQSIKLICYDNSD